MTGWLAVATPLPVVAPLVMAGVALMLNGRAPVQRALSVLTLTTTTVVSVLLLFAVDSRDVVVVQLGGWPAPLGISLVADRLAALLLVTSQGVLLAVLLYAIGQGVASSGRRAAFGVFHPAYLVLAAGVSLSFLTGDLFNLFVAFEVMLTASYVLITVAGTSAQVRTGMTYVVVSLTASALFVAAVALLYAATGTVNMADLAVRLADVDPGVRLALGLMLLVVFGIKAAIFPLYFWLPDSYPTAPAPVTAVFAGLLTKVGVYAIIRTQTLLLGPDLPGQVLLWIGMFTMLVGILGAIAQSEIKRILSFTIVSHIGYMLFGLGLYSVAGLNGAILYTVHHIVTQTTLFLVEGLIERRTGTGALHRLGGLSRSAPLLALLYALPALSLAGIPPFSGFVAKLGLLQAGIADGSPLALASVAVAVVTSLLTLYAMGRVWLRAFWGEPVEAVGDCEPDDELTVSTPGVPRLMTAVASVVVVAGVGIAVLAGPLSAYSGRAAADLMDRTRYTDAVLGVGNGIPEPAIPQAGS